MTMSDDLHGWLLTELAPMDVRLPPVATGHFSRGTVDMMQENGMLSAQEASQVQDKISEYEHLQQLHDAALALQLQQEFLLSYEMKEDGDEDRALAVRLALQDMATEEGVARDGQYARNVVSRHESRRRLQELGDTEMAKTREAELKCADSTLETDLSLAAQIDELERGSADSQECDADVEMLVSAHVGAELVVAESFIENSSGSNADNKQWRFNLFAKEAATPGTCEYCGDETNTLLLPCKHSACFGCLSRQYETTLADMTLAPVKCCKHALPTFVSTLCLPHAKMQSYSQLLRERTTKHKMYCANRLCSEFIGTSALF
jgi:hypothetical protein